MTNLEPRQFDTDFFQNAVINQPVDRQCLQAAFSDVIADEIGKLPASQERVDLSGVLSYLGADQDHDSEGRDLGFDKRSFSRTELRVASRYPTGTMVKYLLYRYRFNHYPRNHQLTDFPLLLAIEPTSVCNIRCTMCFQADEALSRDKSKMGFMSFDTFQRIIDEAAANGLCAIVLASRGEPLLNKDVFKMIRYAKEAGILDVKINTNATRLTPEASEQLLASGPDTVVFSVDAGIKADFERIRVGANFEKVVENISTFNEIRTNRFKDTRTRTRISMVILDERQDADQAVKFWGDLVDEFAHRWAIPRVKIYDQLAVEASRPCSLLWERMYVWWDGIINPCDEDYLSRLSPGRIGSGETIRSIWQGEMMQKYRERHLAAQKNTMIPCNRCPGF